MLSLSILDTLLKIGLEIIKGIPIEQREAFWVKFHEDLEKWRERLEEIRKTLHGNDKEG